MSDAAVAPEPRPWARALLQAEHGLAIALLGGMVALTCAGVLIRWVTGQSMAGINVTVQGMNLWIAFAGAVIASRTGRHLALSSGTFLKLSPRAQAISSAFVAAVATAVTALLAYASLQVVIAERQSHVSMAGGLPAWVIESVMPVGFFLMAVRLAWVGNTGWKGRGVALLSVGAAAALALVPPGSREWVPWVGSALISVAVLLGAPLYTAMGGVAMLLFFGNAVPTPISSVPAETYTIVASPTLPTIPLFTLAGYLLAEGGASRRLVRLFQALVGWIPGGTAAAAVLVCAFFTTFTGASGVTILALGGLLLPILRQAGYSERMAVGLLAASGSIGLLFPPSLPVILYGVVANVAIDKLYIAGTLPGLLLVAIIAGFGLVSSVVNHVPRERLDWRRIGAAIWESKWEIPLPFLVVLGIFGGKVTILEAAALTAAYAFLSEVVIHRDLSITRDIPRVFIETATLVGGVLIILGVALGFTNYLIDAEVPMRGAHWVAEHVGSRFAFILLLNVFLLIVGCLMDIYSAIMVVVPLIVPMAALYGINPYHLGILFLANLELGFLTPPVGMNLFLASYRFDVPMSKVIRMTFPYLLMLALGVLFISYVPALTVGVLSLQDPSAANPDSEEIQKMLQSDEPTDAAEPPPPPVQGLPSAADMMKELNETP